MTRTFVSIFEITLSLNTVIKNRIFRAMATIGALYKHNWQQTEANHHLSVNHFHLLSKQFPTECRKTKTTLANHTDNPMNQSKLEVKTGSWLETRENVRLGVTIGFCFTSDWMKNWRNSFKPIA